MNYEKIGNMIYFSRAIRGISQSKLARYVRVTQPAIANMEKNNPAGYSAKQLKKVAAVFGFHERSLDDESVYSHLPEELRTEKNYAICVALDTYFASTANNGVIFKRLASMGVIDQNDPNNQEGNYIPPSIVFKAISTVYGGDLDKFFDVQLYGPGASPTRTSIDMMFSGIDGKDMLQAIAENFNLNPYPKLMKALEINVEDCFYYLRYLVNFVEELKFLAPDRLAPFMPSIKWFTPVIC